MAAKREQELRAESASQIIVAEQMARQMAERCQAAERKAEVRDSSSVPLLHVAPMY